MSKEYKTKLDKSVEKFVRKYWGKSPKYEQVCHELTGVVNVAIMRSIGSFATPDNSQFLFRKYMTGRDTIHIASMVRGYNLAKRNVINNIRRGGDNNERRS